MNAQLLGTQKRSDPGLGRRSRQALNLLRDHCLAGRLTIDEYEERCDEAARALFINELRQSIRELPYPLPEHEPVASPAPMQPSVTPPTQAAIAAAC